MWVDTHCHLQLSDDDPRAMLERAANADVAWVVVPGVDAATSAAASALAEVHEQVRWTAGLHPHEARRWPQQEAAIIEMASRAAAVGECGLDFYRNLSPAPDQLAALKAQLELAATLDKPAVVHCRDAFAELHELLEASGAGPRTVLHCWTGGPRWTKRFRDLDVTFSFAGPVAFATGDTVRRGAAEAPPERTMVETDTPYLSPPPYRKEANEPARVRLIGEALAEVWSIEVDEVARLSTATAGRVFGG